MTHYIYAKALKNYSSGHALYHPVPAEQIRPGSLGTFDEDGNWQSLAYDVKSVEWPIPLFAGHLQTETEPAYTVDELRAEIKGKLGASLGVNGM